MDTNSTAVIALRLSGRAAKYIGAIGVVSCLAVTGFAAAVHRAGAASSIQSDSDIVSADHTKAIGYHWPQRISQLFRRLS